MREEWRAERKRREDLVLREAARTDALERELRRAVRLNTQLASQATRVATQRTSLSYVIYLSPYYRRLFFFAACRRNSRAPTTRRLQTHHDALVEALPDPPQPSLPAAPGRYEPSPQSVPRQSHYQAPDPPLPLRRRGSSVSVSPSPSPLHDVQERRSEGGSGGGGVGVALWRVPSSMSSGSLGPGGARFAATALKSFVSQNSHERSRAQSVASTASSMTESVRWAKQ